MTDNERNMSRDEMDLRLKVETGLRERYESIGLTYVVKCTKLKKELEAKNEEIGRLREKVTNQKTQLIETQQALTDKNIQIEVLKKEVTERRAVFEPTSYQLDIQAKDEEIKTLRKKNLDLKNENEGLKLKYNHLADVRDARIRERNSLEEQIKELQDDYDSLQEDYDSLKLTCGLMKLNPGYFAPPTQPLYIENLNVTYYENGPVWTSEEEDEDDD